MPVRYINGNVSAPCPDCGGALATFERRDARAEFGTVIVDRPHHFENRLCKRVMYTLMRCGGCGRGGVAVIHDTGNVVDGTLETFFPGCVERAMLPPDVPQGVIAEYREAELCASAKACRGASALLRSALEKTLRANGYAAGSLAERIDEAAHDGVITAARRQRAHDDVRVLGNDVLHHDWRIVTQEEFSAAHHYVQRIVEDFYDHRMEVEVILRAAGRIP